MTCAHHLQQHGNRFFGKLRLVDVGVHFDERDVGAQILFDGVEAGVVRAGINPFDDNEQRRLALFYQKLGSAGAKLMLSNSDPQNENLQDTFFEELYAGFSIHKVLANRRINSNGAKRGPITELLITNY